MAKRFASKSFCGGFFFYFVEVIKVSTTISKDAFDEGIRKIDKQAFVSLVHSINEEGLFSYFALLDKETKQVILNLEPLVWKLANKYQGVLKITESNRRYIILCLCIHIAKYISSKAVPTIIDERKQHIGYKEGLVKHNIFIVEDILMQYSKCGRKYHWLHIQQEFFRRLNKNQLRGSDKLKKDCTKIITTVYFRSLAMKYVFANSKNLKSFLYKKDLDKFIEDNVIEMTENKKELETLIHNDVFNSYRPNL